MSKDNRALTRVWHQNDMWSSHRLWRKLSGKNCSRTSVDRLLKKINSTVVTERPTGSNRSRPVRTSQFQKRKWNLYCAGAHPQSWKYVYKNPYEIGKKDGHFTVVCSTHCKAWSSAENLRASVTVTVIR